MTYENLIKNIFGFWSGMFLIKGKLTDDQIEYMQFGICDHS